MKKVETLDYLWIFCHIDIHTALQTLKHQPGPNIKLMSWIYVYFKSHYHYHFITISLVYFNVVYFRSTNSQTLDQKIELQKTYYLKIILSFSFSTFTVLYFLIKSLTWRNRNSTFPFFRRLSSFCCGKIYPIRGHPVSFKSHFYTWEYSHVMCLASSRYKSNSIPQLLCGQK